MTQDAFLTMAVKATLIYAAAFCGAVLANALMTQGVVIGESGVVGGDFLAFYTAGDFARAGEALAAYDYAAFDARLKELAPLEHLGMMWQYPPTMFFVTAPFALLPYKISLFLWSATWWMALLAALRTVGFHGKTFLLLGFSVLCVTVIDNGQVSMATAALLFLSAYDPKRRWLVAGVAAGLLTIKPQLGLLLPIAYVAAGAWRTIAVAAVSAVLFHASSFFVFGAEGWLDFFAAAARLNADATGPGLLTPPLGMTTLFGQLSILGLPGAAPAQYAAAAAVAVLVGWVWRRSGDPLGKAAVLCAGALLATPYAYSYEMVVLLLPAVYLARTAASLRSPEALSVAGAALFLMLSPALPRLPVLQAPFLITAAAFGWTLFLMLRPAARSAPASAEPHPA